MLPQNSPLYLTSEIVIWDFAAAPSPSIFLPGKSAKHDNKNLFTESMQTFSQCHTLKKILLISVAEPGSHFGSLRQLPAPSHSPCPRPFYYHPLLVKLLLLIIVISTTKTQKLTHMGIKLTMLFIFEEDELALCFRRLLSSSVFPAFGFMISRLPPAVPSEEDLSRFSTNLPSRYGLKLLARSTTNREAISNH